mmetsp:Transcript_17638/g.21379  ORF Transcript_17638/g.21379 Transcript_17638/m.21379 type:complete len:132 (+) Transcript_17638:295-690(+)
MEGKNMAPKLKVMSQPHDSLRKGLPTAVADLTFPKHPVEEMQRNRQEKIQEAKTKALTAQYGIAAAMRYNADTHLLSRFHRMPGIPSSFTGLEVLSGNDTTLNVEDWLGDQDMSAQYFADFHCTMERKLKM